MSDTDATACVSSATRKRKLPVSIELSNCIFFGGVVRLMFLVLDFLVGVDRCFVGDSGEQGDIVLGVLRGDCEAVGGSCGIMVKVK